MHSDDCLQGLEPIRDFDLTWLSPPVPATEVVRVIVADDLWEWSCPNDRYQGELVDRVVAKAAADAPGAIVAFPAGMRTVALPEAWRPKKAFVEGLVARDGPSPFADTDVFMGFDAVVHGRAAPIQTVVRVQRDSREVTLKARPTRFEAPSHAAIDGAGPRTFATRHGRVGVVVCNDALSFLDGRLTIDADIVLLHIHWIGRNHDEWSGEVFRKAAAMLARRVLVVPAFFVPAAEVVESARRFEVMGPDAPRRAATLLATSSPAC